MIKFSNIQIKYNDFVAIDNLNLEIKKGEFFTLLGPSGCGKTTLLRSLLGFTEINLGEISINGQNICNTSIEDRGIGIVFQSYALFPTMSVFENIAFGLKIKKYSKEQITKKVKEIAKKVHLSDEKLHNNVSELSGGQQQRVAIARALVLNPNILCLDEPLSNLDAKLRIELREELKRLQKELKITTIYVTHDQEEALTLSDKIAVFNNGKIEQIGTPKEIYEKSATPFVCEFIGEINKIKKEDLHKLDLKNKGDIYFRLEKISYTNPNKKCVKFTGKIIDIEYKGMYYKITYDVNGVEIKSIEKNNELLNINENDEVVLYLCESDIMEFGDTNEQE